MVVVKSAKSADIHVRGVVQGVGFRPFVYRLGNDHGLTGWVRNTSGSVEIIAEGNENDLNRFVTDLEAKAPPLARVESVEVSFCQPRGYTRFSILQSLAEDGKYQLISPDIAICEDCRREIFDPSDRRYHYPFTNCTNCGPRFTIIEDIPYDRAKTTMRVFQMCPQCQAEYDDPLDRRFHAQPNACPKCGPHLSLVDASGNDLTSGDPLKAASDLLKEGSILAIRGLGGFQLACDATNDNSVGLLRERKRRPAKPFAVMMATIGDIERFCLMSSGERDLLNSTESPIVLLKLRSDAADFSTLVAPGLNYLGVMLPYTPLHHLLMHEKRIPLVMTSGNLSEEPIAKDNEEALRGLTGIADLFLLHNREIFARYDDSVYMVERAPMAIRRARGYAPNPVPLPFKVRQVLACGGEIKNTFCLTKDEYAFVSQHIGDMENEETLQHFVSTIELYEKLFRISPEVIAHDMHPEYLSTKYAQELGETLRLELVPVQHHHAHIVSCLVENANTGPAIGVAFDGTGYGTDGTIWGGEFLVADWESFERVGHLEHVPLLGGSAAILKPYRMALSYVYSLLGEKWLDQLPSGLCPPGECETLIRQLNGRINCPLTSSAGRLFDAVSAISGIRREVTYEAEAAIGLEMLVPDVANSWKYGHYPFDINEKGAMRVVRLGSLFAALLEDVWAQVIPSVISLKFHNTVAHLICQMCQLISKDTGIDHVVLSGGVFTNRILLRFVQSMLREAGLEVFVHRVVPSNDGGISLGQAVIASHNYSS
ncbi:carbamoyltransferase HypF [Chloroflexota bacterium]